MIAKFDQRDVYCGPCLDISPNWMDMQSELGYTLLCSIASLSKDFKYPYY